MQKCLCLRYETVKYLFFQRNDSNSLKSLPRRDQNISASTPIEARQRVSFLFIGNINKENC